MQINTLTELDTNYRGKYVYLVLGDSLVSGTYNGYTSGTSFLYTTDPYIGLMINGIYVTIHNPKLTVGFTELKEFLAYIEYKFGK